MRSPHLWLYAHSLSFSCPTHIHLTCLQTHVVPRIYKTQIEGVTGWLTDWQLDAAPPTSTSTPMRLQCSSWVFSDVCNYPMSRQCLANDREMCTGCALSKNRPRIDQQCLAAGDVVVNEKAGFRQVTSVNRTRILYFSKKKKKTTQKSTIFFTKERN